MSSLAPSNKIQSSLLSKTLTGVFCIFALLAPHLATAGGSPCNAFFFEKSKFPEGLTVLQQGYLPTSSQRQTWFATMMLDLNLDFKTAFFKRNSAFLYDHNRWEYYKDQGLDFTYDSYSRRAFRKTNLDKEAFLNSLKDEDLNFDENRTTHFQFYMGIGRNVVAHTKLTYRKAGDYNLLPVEEKLDRVRDYFRTLKEGTNIVEIGRLSKSPVSPISTEQIFSFLSVNLLQKGIRSGRIVGHAAKTQAHVYEKLGFKVTLDETHLGKDHFLVEMRVRTFLKKFPPPFDRYPIPRFLKPLNAFVQKVVPYPKRNSK